MSSSSRTMTSWGDGIGEMSREKVCGGWGGARHRGMSTTTTSPVRRLALLALGLLVVLTGLGLGSSPASALNPTQPRFLLAAGYQSFIRVYVAPPQWQDTDAPVTGYTV